MTNTPITVHDLAGLPVGAVIRDTCTNQCDDHGTETDWSDYRRREDGDFEVFRVSEDLDPLFQLYSLLGAIKPTTVQNFLDGDAEEPGVHSYELLDEDAASADAEVAA